MPSFNQKSQDQLDTADWKLQRLFCNVILGYDCTVIEGHRSRERHAKLYKAGKSKVKWSEHNHSPSQAVDVAPYLQGRGIPWPKTPEWFKDLTKEQKAEMGSYFKDLAQFYHFAGYVEAVAYDLGYETRWGGDWDRDHDLSDQSFDDLVHFELRRRSHSSSRTA